MAKKNTQEQDQVELEPEAEKSFDEKALDAAKSVEEFTQTVKAKLVVEREFAVNLKGEAREFLAGQILTQDDVDFLGEMTDGRINNGFIKVKVS